MSLRQSSTSKVCAEPLKWEPPNFIERKIAEATKSEREDRHSVQSTEPPLPPPPADKLGFSFEWAFPLSKRTGK